MGSDRKSDEEKFSGDVRTESPKGNKDRFTDKCKRLLEERNRARLMLLNRQMKNKKDIKYAIRKRAKQACYQETEINRRKLQK
jgi:wobble nucleotide-excising tRNase